MLRASARAFVSVREIWKSGLASPKASVEECVFHGKRSSLRSLATAPHWDFSRQDDPEATIRARHDGNSRLCKYATFFDPAIYEVAYRNWRRKAKRNSKATVDESFSESAVQGLIEQMKNRSFQFQPLEVDSIRTPDGKSIPFGTPSFANQLIQEVFRLILEPVFARATSAQATLRRVRKWTGTTWLITANTPGLLNNLDHSVLGEILMRAVKDQQLLDLYWKLVNAGLVKTGNQARHNLTGVSKGGVLWSLFTNIYFSEFDVLLKEFASNVPNSLLTLDPHTGNSRRKLSTGNKIRYIRYGDQWIVGIHGPKSLAIKVRDEIRVYLNGTLKLQVEDESIAISHLASEKVQFLGIWIGTRDRKYVESLTGERAERALGRIVLEAPINEIVTKLVDQGFAVNPEFPRGMSAWIHLEAKEILRRYRNIIRGLMEYYSIVDNRNMMRRVFWMLRFSGIFTLCRKWRISTRALFKKLANDPRYEDFLKGRIASSSR